ncbi:MAG: alanine racemase [Planctomycetia bacterium]|nr:alanine racemase [Planctomycetia bacterium]
MIGPKAIIHLDRLIHNYHEIKNHVGDVPLVTVVKANGYGHGAVPVALALQKEGVNFFAVFTFEEAKELRDNGITGDILIFSRINHTFVEAAADLDITLILSQRIDIDILQDLFQRTHKRPKVHLKIDTGMTRLGVSYDDAEIFLSDLMYSPEIDCEGIYSHFATADEGDPYYAKWQFDRFNEILKIAEKMEFSFKYRHFSNSGAILNLPEAKLNLVRVGMLLYGAYPSDEVPHSLDLKPVMEFIAPIVTVRRVPKGTFISYGGKYKTDKETNIGVIQCGFADGFPRPWYMDGYIMYKGEKFKIAGRVCMDQLLVDFSDTNPLVGEDVLLMGEGKHGLLQAEEISKNIDSTPYVLFTAIGGRTERIFVNN